LLLERSVATDVATDGVDALYALRRSVPDCVVCDDDGWATTGTAFVRTLRAHYPTSRVVRVTTEAAPPSVHPETSSLIDAIVPLRAGVREVARRALAFCSSRDGTGPSPCKMSDHVGAALDYVRLHYAEELTVSGIASAAAVSRGRLATCFREEVGLSLSRYLRSLRVEVAKLLLRSGRAKLDEVAVQCGFWDPSHLSRVFRSLTGHRPGAYRRQLGRD
jgi:AraC-like DNA-binding protein